MARYGAKYPIWAPLATEDAAAPTYTSGEKQVLCELAKVTDAPTMASASQYGDNRAVETVDEFVSATVDVETTDLTAEAAAALYGATAVLEGGVTYGASDTAPYGGFGFICCKIRAGVKSYEGIWYNKVKAVLQGTEYTTKGSELQLAGDKIKFTAVKPAGCETWKDVKSFATEAEAKTWLDKKITPGV